MSQLTATLTKLQPSDLTHNKARPSLLASQLPNLTHLAVKPPSELVSLKALSISFNVQLAMALCPEILKPQHVS